MGKITYSDKDKNGVTPLNQFRDVDANEIKTVVNANDDAVALKVDKVTGKSLVADTEIAKIHASGSDNQDLSGLVPYTGATGNVNLGTNSLGTDEIKTYTTTPTDLLITTGDFKTLVLSEPVWRDEYPAMLVPASGSAAPDAVGHTIGGVARTLYAFDGNATQEILSGSIEIPHDYMVGQPIEVHLHWRPSTTGTGTVIWYFDYEYSPANSAPISQTSLQVEYNIATNKQYFHLLDTFGNMPQPSTPFALGGKIGFNIRRTPTTDSYAGDALLEQVAIHVPCDTQGSRQIYIK